MFNHVTFECDDGRPRAVMMQHEIMSERGQEMGVKVKGRIQVFPVFLHAGNLACRVEIALHLNMTA